VKEQNWKLKPIEICPNGHKYNTGKYGYTCHCGAKLDPPEDMTEEERKELTHVEEKEWFRGSLVCIWGPNKGREYRIHEGKNYIGRASSMDIRIDGDRKIEKHNHAVIVYDQKNKKAMLLPGESRGMIYWQGNAIFEPQELKNEQKIELGESAFSFLQYNDENYEWQPGDAANDTKGTEKEPDKGAE